MGNETARQWIFGSAYLALAVVLVFLHILPIQVGPQGYPGPDLLLCITFAWVLRRPHYLPTPLVAAVFLVTDMLFMRPPGLWTALVVLGVEFLRSREALLRETAFPVEWGTVTAVLLAITLADRLILSIFMVDQAGFGITALQVVATVLTYPLIVLISRFAMGVGKMAPGELDAQGRPR